VVKSKAPTGQEVVQRGYSTPWLFTELMPRNCRILLSACYLLGLPMSKLEVNLTS
jgi:hypothetical protein